MGTEIIDGLSNEILRILRFYRAYRRTIERLRITYLDNTRAEMVDMLICLKCIENDLIMRLCKLDDKGRDAISFKNALNRLAKFEKDHHVINDFKIKHQEYNEHIAEIRRRRNEELGHLKKGNLDHYDLKYNLISAIKFAVYLTDLLHGKTVKYRWKDDQVYEDLRDEIKSLPK